MLSIIRWLTLLLPKAKPQPTIHLSSDYQYSVYKEHKYKYICWACIHQGNGTTSLVGNPAFIEAKTPLAAALEYFQDRIPQQTKQYCAENNLELLAQSKLCPND